MKSTGQTKAKVKVTQNFRVRQLSGRRDLSQQKPKAPEDES